MRTQELIKAASNRKLEEAKQLIEQRADVNGRDENGYMALHRAAKQNDIKIAQLLIEKNADVNATVTGAYCNSNRPEAYQTPLYIALNSFCNFEFVQLLVNARADVNLKCRYTEPLETQNNRIRYNLSPNDGYLTSFVENRGTPLHAVAIQASSDYQKDNVIKIYKYLLEQKADVNATAASNITPLFNALAYWNAYFCYKEPIFDVIKLLIDYKADVRAAEMDYYRIRRDEQTSYKAKGTIVEISGYSYDKTLSRGITHVAARKCPAAFKLIVDLKADIDSRDKYGNTPLHYAGKHPENVKLLIERKADIHTKNKEGDTPLHRAEHFQAIRLLIDSKANINVKNAQNAFPFFTCLGRIDDITVIKHFIELKADIQAKDKEDRTALHYLYIYDSARSDDMVESIINFFVQEKFFSEKKLDVNAQSSEGNTFFHDVALHSLSRSTKLFKLLVDLKADIHLKNKKGQSILQAANYYCRGYEVEKSKYLIEQKANIDLTMEQIQQLLPSLSQKATSFLKRSDYKQAIEWLNVAMRMNSENYEIITNSIKSLTELNQIEQAESLTGKISKLKPDDLEGLMLTAQTLFYRNKLNKALEFCQALSQRQPKHVLALSLQAEILQQLDRSAEAKILYEQIVKLSFQNLYERALIGVAHGALGEHGEALKEIEPALQQDPFKTYPDLTPTRQGFIFAKKAVFLKQLSRHTEALVNLEKAYSLNPYLRQYHNDTEVELRRRIAEAKSTDGHTPPPLIARVLATASDKLLPAEMNIPLLAQQSLHPLDRAPLVAMQRWQDYTQKATSDVKPVLSAACADTNLLLITARGEHKTITAMEVDLMVVQRLSEDKRIQRWPLSVRQSVFGHAQQTIQTHYAGLNTLIAEVKSEQDQPLIAQWRQISCDLAEVNRSLVIKTRATPAISLLKSDTSLSPANKALESLRHMQSLGSDIIQTTGPLVTCFFTNTLKMSETLDQTFNQLSDLNSQLSRCTVSDKSKVLSLGGKIKHTQTLLQSQQFQLNHRLDQFAQAGQALSGLLTLTGNHGLARDVGTIVNVGVGVSNAVNLAMTGFAIGGPVGGVIGAVVGLTQVLGLFGKRDDSGAMVQHCVQQLAEHVDRRFDRVEGMVTQLHHQMHGRFDRLENMMGVVHQQMHDRFDRMENMMGVVHQQMHGRFDRIENMMGIAYQQMHGRFDRMERVLQDIHHYVGNRFQRLEIFLGKSHREIMENFLAHHQEIAQLQKTAHDIQQQLQRLDNQLEKSFREDRQFLYSQLQSDVKHLDRIESSEERQKKALEHSSRLKQWAVEFSACPVVSGDSNEEKSASLNIVALSLKLKSGVSYQINALATYARQQGGIDIRGKLVNPFSWSEAARMYLRLFQICPGLTAVSEKLKLDEDLVEIVKVGQQVNYFVWAIKTSPELFLSLLSHYRQALRLVLYHSYEAILPGKPRKEFSAEIPAELILYRAQQLSEENSSDLLLWSVLPKRKPQRHMLPLTSSEKKTEMKPSEPEEELQWGNSTTDKAFRDISQMILPKETAQQSLLDFTARQSKRRLELLETGVMIEKTRHLADSKSEQFPNLELMRSYFAGNQRFYLTDRQNLNDKLLKATTSSTKNIALDEALDQLTAAHQLLTAFINLGFSERYAYDAKLRLCLQIGLWDKQDFIRACQNYQPHNSDFMLVALQEESLDSLQILESYLLAQVFEAQQAYQQQALSGYPLVDQVLEEMGLFAGVYLPEKLGQKVIAQIKQRETPLIKLKIRPPEEIKLTSVSFLNEIDDFNTEVIIEKTKTEFPVAAKGESELSVTGESTLDSKRSDMGSSSASISSFNSSQLSSTVTDVLPGQKLHSSEGSPWKTGVFRVEASVRLTQQLGKAIRSNDVSKVEQLLQFIKLPKLKNAVLNGTENRDKARTPLALALKLAKNLEDDAQKNALQIVKLLLHHGAAADDPQIEKQLKKLSSTLRDEELQRLLNGEAGLFY